MLERGTTKRREKVQGTGRERAYKGSLFEPGGGQAVSCHQFGGGLTAVM